MRLVMMGTGPFAVPTFRRLLQSPHEIAALVTRPVPDSGRRRRKAPANPMRDVGEEQGLPILTPAGVNDSAAREALQELAADLFVVCDYGQILKAETLALARHGGINLHSSLLPKYRGAAPINWALLEGETETGVTVIHMTPGLDAGPCLVRRSTPIQPAEDAVGLEHRLSELGVEAVMDAIAMLESWDGVTTLGEQQDPTQATRAPRLAKEDGLVDWTHSARRIANQVRALKPWPGTYTFWNRPSGDPLRIVLDQVEVAEMDIRGAEPGAVVEVTKHDLLVATGDVGLRILKLQPAGKKVMATAEFLRGHAIPLGTKFA